MTISERKLMQMGIAALLPGFTLMREVIQATEDEYRALLANLQENGHAPDKKRDRPSRASKTILDAVAAALPAPETVIPVPVGKRGKKAQKKAQKKAWAGWDKFKTKEARAAEAKRRQKLGAARREAKERNPPATEQSPAGPRIVDGKYIVMDVARQLGYRDSWGLMLFLRKHRIPTSSIKFEGKKFGVMTHASYIRLMRIRETKSMSALTKGMSAEEKAQVAELEAATA